MGFQEFLLAVLKNTLNRTMGLIYLGVGTIMSAVDYLNTQTTPQHYLTNSAGNILLYVGSFTIIARTIESWAKQYKEKRRRGALLRLEVQRNAESALANLPLLSGVYLSALKAQMMTGQQRFMVGSANYLLERLMALHIIVRPEQLG